MRKLLVRLLISALVAALFLYLLISNGWIDLSLVMDALQTGRSELWFGFAACLLLALLNYFRYFLIALVAEVATWTHGAFRIAVAHFVSLGVGLWAPGSALVIDTLKVTILRGASRHSARTESRDDRHGLGVLVSITLVDRLIGLSVNSMIGCVASLAFIATAPAEQSYSFWGVVGLAVFSGTVGIVTLVLPLCLRLQFFERLLRSPLLQEDHPQSDLNQPSNLKSKMKQVIASVARKLETLRAGILLCWRRPSAIVGPGIVSVFMSVTAALPLYLSASALGIDLPFLAVLGVSAVLVLAAMLPLGVGGLGGYQAVAGVSMSAFGLDFTEVATANLVQNSLLLLVFTLLGLFFFPSSLPYFGEIMRKRKNTEESTRPK